MSSYHVLREHIDRIRKADENHCRHMWDEYKQDALNEFIDALADLATDVEFSILKKEMPQEEKERLEKLEYEEWIKEEVEMSKKVYTFDARLVDAGRTAGIHQQKRKTHVFLHHVNGNSTFDNHFRGMDPPM